MFLGQKVQQDPVSAAQEGRPGPSNAFKTPREDADVTWMCGVVREGGQLGLEVIRDGARVAALRDVDVLDAPPEESFDRLTRLATAALGVPVSLVTLVDSDRQFFFSQQGLTGDLARARQTPLSHSFCQQVVATREPLLVSDARSDPRVAGNLAVRDLGVVAYAGVPLILADGNAVGAFCALDGRPREWDETQVGILQDLAGAAKDLLDLRAAVVQEGLYDRLTGLPARSLLVAHAEQFLHEARTGRRLVVMCVGLDHFTEINQALGADRADAVLEAAGDRLASLMRSHDVLGRLRSDIFTVLVNDVDDEHGALALAGRIRAGLSASPLAIAGERLSVSATIGIAIAKDRSRGADLISEAANAMRQAKRHHTRTQIAEDGWGERAAAQLQLREALHHALRRGELNIAFQPIVELESGRVRAYEALARWSHPTLGDIPPAGFIPAAEATADIIPIGEWILEQACSQLARWRKAGADALQVTVNLAPLQLEHPSLAETIASILQRAALPPESLVLEITEGVLLENATLQHDNLRRLREQGIQIALDDFGTGYSALGYLKRFPIDILKIDRSFIAGMENGRHDTALIQAILTMATGMDLRLVAEGIETPSQRQLLRLLGCQYGQGFLFARPVPPGDIDPTTVY